MTLLFSKKIRALAKDDVPDRFAAKVIEDDTLAVKQKLCDARRGDYAGLTSDRRITS